MNQTDGPPASNCEHAAEETRAYPGRADRVILLDGSGKGKEARSSLITPPREPHLRPASEAPLERVVSELFSKRIQHEFAQRFSPPTGTLPQPAKNILRHVFDLKVRNIMTIACFEHAG